MGAPDSALPVFSFRPDWAKGITEHLEWMTDVLASDSGAEQRIALRLSARRSFETEIDPLNAERTFLDLFIRRFSGEEFMVPLWHDHALLSASATSGASSLTVDTVDREFVDDGMALLMGVDAFSCEAVQIDTVASGSLTLAAPTASTWPAGTVIHPLRRSWLLEQPKGSHETDQLDSVPMQFLLSGPSDYDGGSEELATFGGYPILSPAPDWSDTLSLEFVRNLVEVDGKVGLRSLGDPNGRAFSIQMHRWFLNGRAEQAAFRRLIARLRGKQAAIWLPTFTSDLTLVADAAIGATYIDVKQCGLAYVGFPAAGRNHAITAAGEMLALSGLDTSPGPDVERVNLSAPLAAALSTGAALSFADIGRLDTDTIDIVHQTDTDGLAQVEAPFRTFPDIRDGSGVSALPLDTATMDDAGCGCDGDPGDGGDDDPGDGGDTGGGHAGYIRIGYWINERSAVPANLTDDASITETTVLPAGSPTPYPSYYNDSAVPSDYPDPYPNRGGGFNLPGLSIGEHTPIGDVYFGDMVSINILQSTTEIVSNPDGTKTYQHRENQLPYDFYPVWRLV